MFFETSDFCVENIAVFQLEWESEDQFSHIRPYHAISFRVEGNASFLRESEEVKAKTGDVFFVPAFCPYKLKAGREKLFVVHFTTSAKLPGKIKKFTPEDGDYYLRLFQNLYNAWSKKQVGFEHECKYLVHKLLMRIEKEYEQSKIYDRTSKIPEAHDYIHENFTDPKLTVHFLAKMCNMSETYFRKQFVERYGAPPLEYINRLRTGYATGLLRSGYYTVSEAADRCGFNNTYYFSAFIKRETGLSPSEIIKNGGDVSASS